MTKDFDPEHKTLVVFSRVCLEHKVPGSQTLFCFFSFIELASIEYELCFSSLSPLFISLLDIL
jgi:hypothetical protein